MAIVYRNIKELWTMLNPNHKKVVIALYHKRKNDEYMRNSYEGYMQIPYIVSYCGFQKNATATGCVQSLRATDLVEMKEQLGFDNIGRRYYRLTNKFYKQLKEAQEKGEIIL